MEGGTSDSGFRDWAHLPLLAVDLISQKIKSVNDYVRFRAVCSSRRSASLPKPPSEQFPPQLPWLMLPYAPHWGMRLFYDLWESKSRKVHIPESVGRTCSASYRGWMLLVADKGSELFLLNPITRLRVNLPSFKTPVAHIWDEGDVPHLKVDYLFESYMGNVAITKVTFSSDPTDPNCVVMVFLQQAHAIFFCRVGDQCWTEVVRPPSPREEPADAAYHNGVFYLLGNEGISIYDPSKHKEQGLFLFEPELRGVSKYFLVGKSGLYLVAVHFIEEEVGVAYNGNYVRPHKHMVDMYHISDDWMLVKVADTNDTTIFYGDRMHYLALCAADWDLLDGGSMYMQYKSSSTDENNFVYRSYSLLFAKLEDGKPQPVLLDFGEQPPIWRSPAPAMWFQQALFKLFYLEDVIPTCFLGRNYSGHFRSPLDSTCSQVANYC